jgi:hypothetical protein
VAEWCRERRIPLLLSIPDSRVIAEGYARGLSILDTLSGSDGALLDLRDRLRAVALAGKAGVAA